MSSISKRVAALATAGALVGGGVLAAVAFGASGTNKDSTTTSSTTTTKGTWRSNEDAAHEKGESAEREAQEDAGHAGGSYREHGGAFRPNEDPAHEKGESAEREAREDAGQRPTVR